MNLSLILADASLYMSEHFDSLTSFTFFVGCMAMMAASVFFFLEMGSVDKKWRTSLLISGIITFIAFVHYYYLPAYYLATGDRPIASRYVARTPTGPLMCVEFYLITKKAGGTMGLMWKLIFASVIMLVTGYWGEALDQSNAWLWGLFSGIAYFYIVYLVWFGAVRQLAANAGGAVAEANKWLGWFVLAGWAIYPIGYMAGTGDFGGGQWYQGLFNLDMDVIYNIGDAINKIGFGLVIYALAIKDSAKS